MKPYTALDELLNISINFAKDQLDKNGEFSPFGYTIQNGEIHAHMPFSEEEPLKGSDLLDLLKGGLQDEISSKKAQAACYTTNTVMKSPVESDVILMHLETEEKSVGAFIPYVVTPEGVTYGEIEFHADAPEFFQAK